MLCEWVTIAWTLGWSQPANANRMGAIRSETTGWYLNPEAVVPGLGKAGGPQLRDRWSTSVFQGRGANCEVIATILHPHSFGVPGRGFFLPFPFVNPLVWRRVEKTLDWAGQPSRCYGITLQRVLFLGFGFHMPCFPGQSIPTGHGSHMIMQQQGVHGLPKHVNYQ